MLKRWKKHKFSNNVLVWFQAHGRQSLPWQINPTPYRVWISEIMLQQTQVTTVVPYFQRFLERFPTLEDLALASVDEVLFLWTGLGYYQRARNLHQSAKILYEQYHEQWPMDTATLQTLPGIGRSTAGAIISLSQNYFAPILDGNVKRVLCRFFCIEEYPRQAKTERILWEIAESLTPQNHAKEYNQAMMDLGATLCTRSKPRCLECPLQEGCQAYQQEKNGGSSVEKYPIKKSKITSPIIHKQFLLLYSTNNHHQKIPRLLLHKRPPLGIWGGLWSLPELPMEDSATQWAQKNGYHAIRESTLPTRKHLFSHFTLHLHPICLHIESDCAKSIKEQEDFYWHSLGQTPPGGLPAPVVKLVDEFYAVFPPHSPSEG